MPDGKERPGRSRLPRCTLRAETGPLPLLVERLRLRDLWPFLLLCLQLLAYLLNLRKDAQQIPTHDLPAIRLAVAALLHCRRNLRQVPAESMPSGADGIPSKSDPMPT